VNRGLQALYAGLVLVSLWSWYTTGAGWNAFLEAMPAIWPFGLAAVMQFLLAHMALRVLPGGQRLIAWPVALVLYVILAIASVTFSIGFYFQVTAAEDYGKRVFTDQYDAVLQDAETLKLAYDTAAGKLADFAALSRDMAKQEAARGGTCREDRGGGPGEFFSLRTYQADRFTSMAGEVADRSGLIEQKLADLRAVKGATELGVQQRLERLKAHYRKLRALYQNELDGVAEELRKHRNWHAVGYPDAPGFRAFAGAELACADPVSLSRFDDIIGTLERLPEPRDYEIRVFDPDNERAIINMVLAAIGDLLLGGAADEADARSAVDEELFSAAYQTAVGLGLLVDVIILLLGIFIQLANRPTRAFWRQVPSPGEVALVSDLFVKLYERCRELRYLTDPQKASAPIDLTLSGDGRQLPESAGAAANFVEAVLEKLEIQIDGGSYLFEPEQSAAMDEVGVELQDFVRDVRKILSDARLIGEPAHNQGSDFLGRNLTNLLANFGLAPGVLVHKAELTAYQVHPVLTEKIIPRMNAYAGTRIDNVPGVRAWYQDLHFLPNFSKSHHLALVFQQDAHAKARYVHHKMLPGTRRVILFARHEAERQIIRWLRSADGELNLNHHVSDRPARLRGIPLPLPWRVLELDEHADQIIDRLAH